MTKENAELIESLNLAKFSLGNLRIGETKRKKHVDNIDKVINAIKADSS